MNRKMSNIIRLIQEQQESKKTCERHIANLENDALTECSIQIGDTIFVNYGCTHIGKHMRVIKRSFYLAQNHDCEKPHWHFAGNVLRADKSISNRYGESIDEIN